MLPEGALSATTPPFRPVVIMDPQGAAVVPGGVYEPPKKSAPTTGGPFEGWARLRLVVVVCSLGLLMPERAQVRGPGSSSLLGMGDWIASGDRRRLRVRRLGVGRHVSRGQTQRPHPPPEAPFSPVDADNENSIVPLLEPCEPPENIGTLNQVGETKREAHLSSPS